MPIQEERKQFMKRAIELARTNIYRNHGGPFGAVVVKNGKIIGEGANEVVHTNDPTAHAEVVAIRNACQHLKSFQLEGCEIYTSCEPCPMCLGAIYWARPNKVYYAATREDAANANFDDSLIYNECNTHLDDRKIPFEQISQEEAKAVFEHWIKNENKVPY
jgi:guanine deaminase